MKPFADTGTIELEVKNIICCWDQFDMQRFKQLANNYDDYSNDEFNYQLHDYFLTKYEILCYPGIEFDLRTYISEF